MLDYVGLPTRRNTPSIAGHKLRPQWPRLHQGGYTMAPWHGGNPSVAMAPCALSLLWRSSTPQRPRHGSWLVCLCPRYQGTEASTELQKTRWTRDVFWIATWGCNRCKLGTARQQTCLLWWIGWSEKLQETMLSFCKSNEYGPFSCKCPNHLHLQPRNEDLLNLLNLLTGA